MSAAGDGEPSPTPAGAVAALAGDLDGLERLLWAVMGRFEDEALARYDAARPELASPAKRRVVDALRARAATADELAASTVGPAVARIIEAARRGGDADLFLRGLLLERLGQTIYDAVAASPALPEGSRELARAAAAAAREVHERALAAIPAALGAGGDAFARFAAETHDVLRLLDGLGEDVDALFGERLGLRFADLLGDLVADLVPSCVGLGMARREVVCHLTGALMGI